MKINGRALSRKIQSDLSRETEKLKKKGTIPHLVVILVGSDPSSKAYIRQKIKQGEEVGIKVTLKNFQKNTSGTTLFNFVNRQNTDPSVHGIIIQRPLPIKVDLDRLNTAVVPEKDVDGFHPESKFEPPLALAVMQILEEIYSKEKTNHSFIEWLTGKNLVFIGRGEAGGKPVITHVEKLGIPHSVIHTQTENPEKLKKKADIIITTVGKDDIVRADEIKKGVILIGIGLHKKPDGKLYADYDEEEIKDLASYYTPVPGGVGPVNVTMLIANVIAGAKTVR